MIGSNEFVKGTTVFGHGFKTSVNVLRELPTRIVRTSSSNNIEELEQNDPFR